MRTYKLIISKDGSRFIHIYNDTLKLLDESLGDFDIYRASDVYFCNKARKWKVRFLNTGEISPLEFDTREEALDWEHDHLQNTLNLV